MYARKVKVNLAIILHFHNVILLSLNVQQSFYPYAHVFSKRCIFEAFNIEIITQNQLLSKCNTERSRFSNYQISPLTF